MGVRLLQNPVSTGRLDGVCDSGDIHVVFQYPVGQPSHCHVQVWFNSIIQISHSSNQVFAFGVNYGMPHIDVFF